tara:strand:- start:2592 stop:2948 length:357 start_codon:yes stop_codon:yes gene_type:complete
MKTLTLFSIVGLFLIQFTGCKKYFNSINASKIQQNWTQIEPACTTCMDITFNDDGSLTSNATYLDGKSYSFVDGTSIRINDREYNYKFKENNNILLIEGFSRSLIGMGSKDVLLQKQY